MSSLKVWKVAISSLKFFSPLRLLISSWPLANLSSSPHTGRLLLPSFFKDKDCRLYLRRKQNIFISDKEKGFILSVSDLHLRQRERVYHLCLIRRHFYLYLRGRRFGFVWNKDDNLCLRQRRGEQVKMSFLTLLNTGKYILKLEYFTLYHLV